MTVTGYTETQALIHWLGAADLYKKTALVHAVLATQDGVIDTLEGQMEYKAGEHYIVSDDPATHVWPVRKDIFESTYTSVEDK